MPDSVLGFRDQCHSRRMTPSLDGRMRRSAIKDSKVQDQLLYAILCREGVPHERECQIDHKTLVRGGAFAAEVNLEFVEADGRAGRRMCVWKTRMGSMMFRTSFGQATLNVPLGSLNMRTR